MKAILQLLVICYCFLQSLSLSSFTLQQKNVSSSVLSTSLWNEISSFEIDSHVEVVLVGDLFDAGKDGYDITNDLTATFDTLSYVATKYSPYFNVHEKLIFHFGRSKLIENEIKKVFKNQLLNNIVNPSMLHNIFKEYHHQSSVATTLFILHITMESSYSYSENLFSDMNCNQRTFIANEGFAWIDLNVRSSNVIPLNPVDNIIPEPIFFNIPPKKISYHKNKSPTTYYELATLIYRSGEALLPFPISLEEEKIYSKNKFIINNNNNNDISNMNTPSLPHAYLINDENGNKKQIDILAITLCFDDQPALCESDENIESLINQYIIRNNIETGNKISITPMKYSVHEEIQISHAFHSSSIMNDDKNSYLLNSSDLLYWLGSCTLIRETIFKMNKSWQNRHINDHDATSNIIIPLFIIRPPQSTVFPLYLDVENSFTTTKNFNEPPGGWGLSKLDKDEEILETYKLLDILEWPKKAVIAIRPKVYTAHNPYMCDGKAFTSNENYYNNQLIDALREAIWNISPPYLHYSASSRHIVTDYLWWSVTKIEINNNELNSLFNTRNSFRDTRAIPRSILIKRCEYVISSLSILLNDIANIVPSVSYSDILGEINYRNNDDYKNDKNRYLKFLYHMDEAAIGISHLEYELARSNINSAETILLQIQDIIHSRTVISGTVSCESNTFSNTNDPYSLNILKNVTTAYPYMNVILLLAALLGIGGGGYIASINFNRNKKN